MEANQGMSFGELSKKMGSIWKELSDLDKAPYQLEAAQDKARYATEKKKAAYKGEPQTKQAMNAYMCFSKT